MADHKRRFRGPHARRAEAQADEVVEHILEKLQVPPGSPRHTFVASRFRDRMIRHLTVAPRENIAFGSLSIVSVAAGVAVSSLADNQDVVFGLGLLIAASSAANQVWKFGPRSAVRFRSGNALRQEGWDFVMGRGRYITAKDNEEAWKAFYDVVWQIERASDAMVEADPEGGQG